MHRSFLASTHRRIDATRLYDRVRVAQTLTTGAQGTCRIARRTAEPTSPRITSHHSPTIEIENPSQPLSPTVCTAVVVTFGSATIRANPLRTPTTSGS